MLLQIFRHVPLAGGGIILQIGWLHDPAKTCSQVAAWCCEPAKIAQLLGCSWVSVSRWEQGHSSPMPAVADIYRALDGALQAGNSPKEIVDASKGERGTFLQRLFTMAYQPQGATR